MKKVLPIIIVAVIVLGAGAWWFLGRGGGSLPIPTPGGIKKEAGEAGESFTGKLKAVVALGTPMKCTYQQGDLTGTGYIKGKKYYGELAQGDKKGYVIMKDNCMWSWSTDEPQGVKMCFEEDIFEESEEAEGVVPVEAEYHCAPAVFSDSKFDPPANINFMDMDQMMQDMEGMGG
jgi:hypothetical protein